MTSTLFAGRTGVSWNDLPTALLGASGATCWRRLKEWHVSAGSPHPSPDAAPSTAPAWVHPWYWFLAQFGQVVGGQPQIGDG
jgi:transposase